MYSSEAVAGNLMWLQQVSEALDDPAAATGAPEQHTDASATDYYNPDAFYSVNCADRPYEPAPELVTDYLVDGEVPDERVTCETSA